MVSRQRRDRACSSSALARLLEAPRYEVIPVHGIEEKVAVLPPGSDRHGDRLAEPRHREDDRRERRVSPRAATVSSPTWPRA